MSPLKDSFMLKMVFHGPALRDFAAEREERDGAEEEAKRRRWSRRTCVVVRSNVLDRHEGMVDNIMMASPGKEGRGYEGINIILLHLLRVAAGSATLAPPHDPPFLSPLRHRPTILFSPFSLVHCLLSSHGSSRKCFLLTSYPRYFLRTLFPRPSVTALSLSI